MVSIKRRTRTTYSSQLFDIALCEEHTQMGNFASCVLEDGAYCGISNGSRWIGSAKVKLNNSMADLVLPLLAAACGSWSPNSPSMSCCVGIGRNPPEVARQSGIAWLHG